MNCGKCAAGYEPDLEYPNRCKLQLFYRNSSTNFLVPKLPETGETIVTSTNTRLRMDPNSLALVVSYGETAMLRCVAQSLMNKNSELVPIIWIREGAQLPQQNRQTQGILEIFNAQPEDSGVYYCISTDPDGTTLKLRAQLRVILDPAKRTKDNYEMMNPIANNPNSQASQLNVRIEPRILNVKTNEPISLRCIVQGREPISINWYKSTLANELQPERRILNNALVINSAQYSDSGDYYCEASNGQNTYKARSRVIVSEQDYNRGNQEPSNPYPNYPEERYRQDKDSMNVIIPPSLTVMPERQTIVQGKSGTIHCIVGSGNPTPKITWSKARSELSPSRHFILNSGNRSSLEIRDSRTEDRGLYVCR